MTEVEKKVDAPVDNDVVENTVDEVVEQDAPEVEATDDEAVEDKEQETFDRKYVERLRKESGDYRTRARAAEQKVEGLQARLHAALVAADGRLADPSDLPFDEAHLEDEAALEAAIGELVERKPGLRARRYGGDVGAGDRSTPKGANTDLIELIRGMQ